MADLLNSVRLSPINEAINFIIDQKDINIIDEYHQSMLHQSFFRKDGFPLVELLLFWGINTEMRDSMNYTAWTYA